jgi:hypothetical protein
MKSVYWFFCDVFLINFYICADFTPEETDREIKRQYDVDVELSKTAGASTIDVVNEKGVYGIFLRIERGRTTELVHECVHMANKVFNRIGYYPALENDEVQAYYVGYLFEKISGLLNTEVKNEI